MSAIAQELDPKIVGVVRDALRPSCDDAIALSCLVIDVIREINERGYVIVKQPEWRKN